MDCGVTGQNLASFSRKNLCHTLETQSVEYSQLPPYCRDVKCECHQPERHKLNVFKEKFHKGLFWHIKREANKSFVQRSTPRDCINIFYEVSFN